MQSEERYSRWAALTIAALFTAITTRYALFVGVIADGSGYISEARRWLDGQLFGSLAFSQLPQLPSSFLEVPLGYRLAAVTGTDVFTYPPGLPLVMAGAMAIGGELAAHLVPPLLGGILVWATGELASLLGGRFARVLGAALMATSAIALEMAIAPMSDVPAAAWWTLSLVFAARGRASAALAAGLAVTMAILTRPNLAPLAIVPAALVFATTSLRPSLPRAAFLMSTAFGPLVLMWTQAILYGSAFASGHLGIENLFALRHIPSNLLRYPGWYSEAHTPAILLAALAPILVWSLPKPSDGLDPKGMRRAALALLVFAVGVYVAYLPYFPYSEPAFLRFMLPALAPLYALTAVALGYGIDSLAGPLRLPAVVVALALTAGAQAYQAQQGGLIQTASSSAKPVLLAGAYLESALPPNAVVMTAFHSGSVRYATRRPILRPDLVPPEQLDSVIALLQAFDYRPFVLIDEQLERNGFRQQLLPHTKAVTLDWPPRARIGDHGRLTLYDVEDAQRSRRGEQWPIDIVR